MAFNILLFNILLKKLHKFVSLCVVNCYLRLKLATFYPYVILPEQIVSVNFRVYQYEPIRSKVRKFPVSRSINRLICKLSFMKKPSLGEVSNPLSYPTWLAMGNCFMNTSKIKQKSSCLFEKYPLKSHTSRLAKITFYVLCCYLICLS